MKGVNITITREQVQSLTAMLELAVKNTPLLERTGEFWVTHANAERVVLNAQMEFAHQKARSQLRSNVSLADGVPAYLGSYGMKANGQLP